MDKEIRDEWCKRLRSDEYKQGTGYLKRVNPDTGEVEHCCKGVLGEILVERGLLTLTQDDDGVFVFGLGYSSLLPTEVMNRVGLASANPTVEATIDGLRYRQQLTVFNDADGAADPDCDCTICAAMPPRRLTFSEIADVIEEQL